MDDSSPLAALHRPVPVPSWGSNDMFRSHAHSLFSTTNTGAGKFSLRERLHKPIPDYFSIKDVRGSSPAASLAADLSQNFRIDNEASPQFPTPRRALFTGMSSMMGGDENRSYVTTPPLPSSSPGQLNELMEMSPLPHKTPFSATQIEVTSPTPLSTPVDIEDEEMILDSPAPIARQTLLEPPKPLVTSERKKAQPRRPSLTRMKGFSTCGVPGRANTFTEASQLPTFRFGGETRLSHMSSALSLGECFESASPPQERRPQTANSPSANAPGALRTRVQFSSISGLGATRHAPSTNNHGRRPSNPFMRPRKQFRRSLSMFEHPGDIMKPKADDNSAAAAAAASSELQAVMDIEEPHQPVLPHFSADDPSDTIPRISKQTMLEVLDGKYCEHFDQKMVIDCRFEYEYDGGHIDSAVNYNSKELLTSQLFQTPMDGRTLLIFHCEYSAHRAPLMARHVRAEDRTANVEHYPRLTYPEVYILDGGYSGFFSTHRNRCYPPNYVEMSDEKHQRTCERELGRLKNGRKGLNRAATFAYGHREPCVDESPTSAPRPGLSVRLDPVAMIGNSPILGERSQTRRMASY